MCVCVHVPKCVQGNKGGILQLYSAVICIVIYLEREPKVRIKFKVEYSANKKRKQVKKGSIATIVATVSCLKRDRKFFVKNEITIIPFISEMLFYCEFDFLKLKKIPRMKGRCILCAGIQPLTTNNHKFGRVQMLILGYI